MKIPIGVHCVCCAKENAIRIELHDPSISFVCTECGMQNEGPFGLGFDVGDRVLQRAHFGFHSNRDYSMSIVLSAMAVECQVSHLHHKWEQIGAMLSSVMVGDAELDERLRRYQNAATRLEHVAQLMYPSGLDDFVVSRSELTKTIRNGFPSLGLRQFAIGFQQALFWPRNRILHLADMRYGEADATRCFNLAALGIHIFQELDLEKRKSSSI